MKWNLTSFHRRSSHEIGEFEYNMAGQSEKFFLQREGENSILRCLRIIYLRDNFIITERRSETSFSDNYSKMELN